ncbi:hypothetical protein B9Z65_5192 [Elsinoe australis]|uniref:RRM domain-containing protein n=1 Tax=Elsinoe australis TaxID=40998 RepID=A0A2P7ZDC1_9PEZI|nr:hypothetical protein B9Z65_5192 [Elsinoe australis]
MADGPEAEEDIFADLQVPDAPPPAASAPVPAPVKEETQEASIQHAQQEEPSVVQAESAADYNQSYDATANGQGDYNNGDGQNMQGLQDWSGQGQGYGQDSYGGQQQEEERPIGTKEDGKMFIGGLNWETTDQSLRDYFTQFGEVSECTVMRDSASGRSRGFGFLTFRDPKCVNTVMVKEHQLDGKIIDPKRAIPREEQERTSKIFVGGVSQEATEHDFKTFFQQFGRVLDATLMMDKDTGRPRGFGFVTFDSEAAVDRTLQGPLEILGKSIEVKKAQPRGNMVNDEEGGAGRGRGRGRGGFGGGGAGQGGQGGAGPEMGGMMGMGGGMGGPGGPNMTPNMMAQYWARMQQYFQMMQQNMMGGGQGMGQMNPMMQQQMMQMMQQNGGKMDPRMMQQMQQQQGGGRGQGPPFGAQEQMAFEQQKYERQQGPGMGGSGSPFGGSGAGTSWEGMYDDVPAPQGTDDGQGGGGGGFGGFRGRGRGGYRGGRGRGGGQQQQQGPPANAPVNAPTGPKNAGRPGSNYRGGGRGGHRGFHPYARG